MNRYVNEHGSSMLMILILSAVLGLSAAFLVGFIVNSNNRDKNLEAKSDISTMVNVVQLTLKHSNNCQNGLLSHIQPNSSIELANNQQVVPGWTREFLKIDTFGQDLLVKDLSVPGNSRMLVDRIEVSNLKSVAMNRFLGDLRIQFKQAANSVLVPINAQHNSMAIQFTTSGSGLTRNIVDCKVVGAAGQTSDEYIDFLRSACVAKGGAFTLSTLRCERPAPSNCAQGSYPSGLDANWNPICVGS